MQFKSHESKRTSCKSAAGSGAGGPHTDGMEGERKGKGAVCAGKL